LNFKKIFYISWHSKKNFVNFWNLLFQNCII
jgi:hypothetical protein